MSLKHALNRAHATALRRWQEPFAGYASGHDRRTSDAALLELWYGGLRQAAAHDWLNAGRRLIDKTYVTMLWHVQHLARLPARLPEQTAAALDDFIRDQVAPRWPTLGSLSADDRHVVAVDWVEHLSMHGFGSLRSEAAASRLLFYLCPMLPVFNLSTGHRRGLRALGYDAGDDRYRGFAASASAAYDDMAPALAGLAPPPAPGGEMPQSTAVQSVLDAGDWWTRRVFDQLLRDQVPTDAAALFGCDDAGGLLDDPPQNP